jgi:hypothetical protein
MYFLSFLVQMVKKRTTSFELQQLADVVLIVHRGPIKTCHGTTDRPCQQLSVPLEALDITLSKRSVQPVVGTSLSRIIASHT